MTTFFTALLRACAWSAVAVVAIAIVVTSPVLPPVVLITPPALVAQP